MKTNRVWAVYFTGTQTTSKVVEKLADELAGRLGCDRLTYDFSLPQARTEPMEFSAGDLVVFGTPVIAGRVPNVLLKYLADIRGNGALGVPVVLYGNRNYDDALIELRDIMEAGGIRTVAAGAFIGEHSFSKVLGAGRPDEQDMAKVSGFAEDIFNKISSADSFEMIEVKGTPKPYSGYYQPRDRQGVHIDIRKVKPKTDESRCIKCGKCAKICTMGSIDAEDFSKVTGICIKCCACIKRCPAGAKYYDDKGYLYHQHELEQQWVRRAEPETFI